MIDPSYVSAPAVLLRHTVTIMTGYGVHIEHHLRSGAMRIDHKMSKIFVREGLGLENYNWLMWRAIVRLLFGKEFAPEFLEFPDRPVLTLVRGHAGLDADGHPYTMPLTCLSFGEHEHEPDPCCPYIEGEPVLAVVRTAP